MNIPLPKVVGDVGPGGPFVTTANALNDLRIKQSQAQYAPYNNYADALSKIAYSQTSPANALATFMSGPAAANLSREQQQALATQMQNYLQQKNMANDIPTPGNIGSGGLFGNFGGLAGAGLKLLLNKIAPGMQNAVNQTPSSTTQNALNQPVTSQGSSTPLPTTNPSTAGRFNAQASALNLPGTQGGNNPGAAAKAQEAALQTGVTGEASAQVEQQKNMEDQDNSAAKEATDQLNLLNTVRDVHKKIPFWQKGFVGGQAPAIESNRQEFDSKMAQVVSSIANQQGNGNVTNDGRSLARESKFPANLNDQAFDHLINYADGMQQRIQEKPAFNKAFSSIGKTPAEIKILWLYYQSMKPFYDIKNHEINHDNLKSWDQFYSSQNKIDAAFNPSAQKKIEKVMGNTTPTENPASASPTGTQLPEGVVQKTQDIGGKQAVMINNDWYWSK